MMVQAKFGALKGIKPHEFALRFVFGGLVCVVAGLIAKSFGPGIGGLFLAFPAIFPAGASLVESHEKMHKARAGFDGTRRGRAVASIDAAGAAIGCIGLAWIRYRALDPAAKLEYLRRLHVGQPCLANGLRWLLDDSQKPRLPRVRHAHACSRPHPTTVQDSLRRYGWS